MLFLVYNENITIVLVGCVEACDEKRFSNTVRLHVLVFTIAGADQVQSGRRFRYRIAL